MAGFEAVIHSIISGGFAASAGAAGKLAFDKALISNGCLELQSVFESSELLNWLRTLEFYPNVILHTDVCNNQVGTLLFPFRIMFHISSNQNRRDLSTDWGSNSKLFFYVIHLHNLTVLYQTTWICEIFLLLIEVFQEKGLKIIF